MDEELNILNSQEELTTLLRKTSPEQQDVVITEYLKELKYPPVKDFQKGLEWFNVSEPLSFSSHLKGKLVLLDFFTYCCINCMHILPDLKDLENDFSVEDGLVVVGVHSAKFENEKLSKNIMAAVQRYNITHPVVNDHDSVMWKNCEVCCWPTLLLLGPNANPIVMLMGEGHKDVLQLTIRNALTFYKSQKLISNHKIPFQSAYHFLPDQKGPLLFPGKITSFINTKTNSEILGLSDTGNNRILIIQNDGTVLHQIGGSNIGFKDGNFEEALFNAPQGLVFRNDREMFVADTENHAIRKIDFKEKLVSTVVGTGDQGSDHKGGNDGIMQEISSPWDVCLHKLDDTKEILLIAMAGVHQIWALFLSSVNWWKNTSHAAGTCAAIAGSGREENKNNTYPNAAGFAQPSGLALCEKSKVLFIADSESSSVRKMSLIDGKVSAVVGGDVDPRNLFAFGDQDGKQYDAKLQHVLGLAKAKTADIVFVADTYNHKIKKVDINSNTITTMDVIDPLNEPGGMCMGDGDKKLYVADTNNHMIKILHLDDKYSIVRTENLRLKFPSGSLPLTDKSVHDVHSAKPVNLNLKGGKLILAVNFDLGNGVGLTNEAPQSWTIHLPSSSWSCVPTSGANVFNVDVVLSIPPEESDQIVNVDILYKLMTCKGDVCIPKKFVIRQPINFTEDGLIKVDHKINFLLDQSKVIFQSKY
ncbi:hypothetical protein FQR65_LT08478 [Abscondita terminalis]|nr:hypothetical protein FQR65_LT08478 [Abscondita terminalis]